MRKIALIIAAASAVFSVSLSAQQKQPSGEEPIALKEFMAHVMQRNAEQLWRWSAYEIDEKGEHSFRPRTDKEWEDAESDSLTIQQLTFVLQQPGRRVDDPRWDEHLAALRAAAVDSANAAERKDYDTLEKAGNDVNDRCVACHLTFAPELEVPPT